MADNKQQNPEQLEQVEERLIRSLTNEPSAPIKLENYDVYVVFQRPAFSEKYKGRAWAAKKLRSFGLGDAVEEDPDLTYFFRYWGTLNTYVKRILIPAEKNGDIIVEGKHYVDYTYDPRREYDYSSLFEKYVIEEQYNKGYAEDAFVSDVITAHVEWLAENTVPEEDIKNS